MKKLLVAYSSNTGNTLKLCQNAVELLDDDYQVTLKPVDEVDSYQGYDLVVPAFWVNRGTANGEAKKFIKKIKGQNVAFLATMASKTDSEHAERVRQNAPQLVAEDNNYLGIFLARGKVDPKLAKRTKFLPLPKDLKERIYLSSINSREPNQEEFKVAAEFLKTILNKL